MESSGGYPSAPSAESAPTAADAQVFALEGDDDDVGTDDPSAEAEAATVQGTDATSPSWYDLDEADANKHVQQLSEESSQAGAQQPAATTAPASGSRFGQLFGTASSLRQKATPFFSKAKKALEEEAKQLAEDARDIAGGVREGMQLTRQDLEDQTKGWRSVLGGKFRSAGTEPAENPAAEPPSEEPFWSVSETQAASSSRSSSKANSNSEAEEVSAAETAPPRALQALKQNLAVTADVSKEMWKDVRELKQEVFNEVRMSVHDIRQVGSQVRQAWRGSSDGADDADPYWLLPSTRANYVSNGPPEEAPSAPGAAVNRVRTLGGKLKGSLARKGREVSSGVASLASDIRQNMKEAAADESSFKKRVQARLGISKDASGEDAGGEDAVDGDSIFEIGSDEEDAWSDHDGGFSDGNSSETPSTRSASLAAQGVGLAAPSEAGSTEGVADSSETR